MLTLSGATALVVADDWRVKAADVHGDGALMLTLVRAAASIEIRIDPHSAGRRSLAATPNGDVSYSRVHGADDREAAEVTRRLARELEQGRLERISNAWPHLALPALEVDAAARVVASDAIASWLGLSGGAQLDEWRLRAVREQAGGAGVLLAVEHATTQERATIAVAGPVPQAFASVGPWTVAPVPDVPGSGASRAVLRLCSGLATLIADRMAADPAQPAQPASGSDAADPVLAKLRERGLDVTAVRRGTAELGVVVQGPAGEASLTVTRRYGRISSFRSGRHLAVVPDGVAAGQAAWLTDVCDALLDAEPTLVEALGTSEKDEIPTGRLVPARTSPGPGLVVARERTAALLLTSPCLADCVFCGQETTHSFTLEPVEDVLAAIRRDAPLYDRVIVIGFEPLTHPGVVAMIAACREAGVREVEVMTSGVALGTPGMVRALVDAGLTHVAVPLYAPDPAVNDLIMRRAGAFDLTARALDALAEAGVETFVHSLLLAVALDGIDRLQGLVKQRWGARFAAAAPRSKTAYATIAPLYRDVDAAVRETPIVGMPLCIVPRMLAHPDLQPDRPLQLTLGELAESTRSYFMQGLVHPEACAGCAARHACTGVLPEQLAHEPQLPIVPVASLPPKPRA